MLRGVLKIDFWKNLGFCPPQGGGVCQSKFLSIFFKTRFALELSINVMKHTVHKWGGNISLIQ